MDTIEKQLKDMLPKIFTDDAGVRESLQIIPIYDVANNKLHYQTEPYLDEDGKIKVKRLATFDVEVHRMHQIIEEYSLPLPTNPGESKDGK